VVPDKGILSSEPVIGQDGGKGGGKDGGKDGLSPLMIVHHEQISGGGRKSWAMARCRQLN
jgi:hypothetical protein